MLPSRASVNAQRHALIAAYRRTVWERYEVVPFPHQAEWILAGEGFTLTPDIATDGQASQLVMLENGSTEPRVILPRPGGAAHVLADLAGFKSGKALALDTPIPTPRGWSTIGDVVIGQEVFDELGCPTTITDVGPVHVDPTGTFRVVFDDGSIVECGGQHEWVASTPKERSRHPGLVVARETRAMIPPVNKHKQRVYGVPVCGAFQLPDVDLPIPPYTLGAWLGDGHSHDGVITKPDRDFMAFIEADGYTIWRIPSALYGWRIDGLSQQLKRNGLVRNKHVPPEYFRSSESQRLRLLQGLLDSDGHCHPRNGRVEFMNTNERLALAVFELATSLGIKPHMHTKRATLYGKDCGIAYRVTWTHSMPVFRLPRKARFLKTLVGGKVSYRHIDKIERIDDRAVRCITVSSPSHLFLCGEGAIPTHNSWSGGMWLAGFAGVDNAAVDIVGLEYDTCEPEFNYLTEFLLAERGMNLPYESLRNNKKEGAMWITLENGTHFQCKSWRASRKSETMKGKTRDAYYFAEAYQLPGMHVWTHVAQNVRQRDGFGVFATTPDRAWVRELHDKAHGKDAYYHCTCDIDAQCNPFTFDQAAKDRDDPDKGGLMTRERFAVAWGGKVNRHIGAVYDYEKPSQMFSPMNFPQLWDADGIQLAAEMIR